MKRRQALKMAAAASVGGLSLLSLTRALGPKKEVAKAPHKMTFREDDSKWDYTFLDPAVTAEIAYAHFPDGSCMYGVFSSIVSQLGEIIGEPFASFPIRMMKYGHGGVAGAGTICGALNGSAALIGLLIEDKKTRDVLVSAVFRMYETTSLPIFEPKVAAYEYLPPRSVAKSYLCHASSTRWTKTAGVSIDSKERKERCRRLTADIAGQTVAVLNSYYENTFMANEPMGAEGQECLVCHGPEGKLGNVSGSMNCTSCHDESLGHRLFSDVHYKMLKK